MGCFPKLRELVIFECPKLASVPTIPWRTDAPCFAKVEGTGLGVRLDFSRTNNYSYLTLKFGREDGSAGVLWQVLNFSNLTDLKGLYMINDCGITSGKELTLLLSFFPNLSTLDIRDCENIIGLGVAEDAETVSEEQRQQSRVGSVEEIITAAVSEEGLLLLPPHLQNLQIWYCPNVSILPNPSQDDRTKKAAAGGGLQRLESLRLLFVVECPEFLSSYSSSSSSSFLFPTCLQHLTLLGVKHMETLQSLSNLTSLTGLQLDIRGDSRDEGLWPLLAHGRLTSLTLYIGADSDLFIGSHAARPHDKEVFSRSCKLFHLRTSTNTGILAGPICNLLSSTLTKLDLSFDTEVERLTEEQEEALQLLTHLQELYFSGGDKLQRLPAGLPNLINLKNLTIYNCSAIQSLPSLPSSLQELQIESSDAIKSLPNRLPNSLKILTISCCKSIKSLPNSLPISLEKLTIYNCGAIKSLPKDGLPSSTIELDVKDGNSEELKRVCHKLIGTIPIVRT